MSYVITAYLAGAAIRGCLLLFELILAVCSGYKPHPVDAIVCIVDVVFWPITLPFYVWNTIKNMKEQP